MRTRGAVLFTTILVAALALPQGILAADEEIQKKVDALSKEVQSLQQQVAQSKEGKKSISDWLTIGGDYRFRIDSLRGEVPAYYQFNPADPFNPPLVDSFKVKNDVLYTNRFGLDLKAKAARSVTVTSRHGFPTISSRRNPDLARKEGLANRILPSGEMASMPSARDSTRSESNDSGVFMAASVPGESDRRLYTAFSILLSGGTFQGLNGHSGMKHTVSSL